MLEIEFGIENIEDIPKWFIDGRVGAVTFGGEIIGYVGEIHPRVLKNFKIKMPIGLLEIEIDKILENFK